MTKIVSTITATTPSEYAEQWQILSQFAERIHIDITDGDFAPSQTVNPNQVYWDKGEILKQVDLHLMMKRPIDWLDQIVSLAPDLVILHAESDDALVNLPRIFEHLHKFTIKVGVALLPETMVRDSIAAGELVLIAPSPARQIEFQSCIRASERDPLILDMFERTRTLQVDLSAPA